MQNRDIFTYETSNLSLISDSKIEPECVNLSSNNGSPYYFGSQEAPRQASMEVLSRLFPYTKTVAGLKTTFTHVFRLKDPTADARRTARARIPSMRSHRELHPLRAHLRAPLTLEDMKRRAFTPITTKLAGLSFPLSQKRSYDFCLSRLSKKHEVNSEVYV